MKRNEMQNTSSRYALLKAMMSSGKFFVSPKTAESDLIRIGVYLS